MSFLCHIYCPYWSPFPAHHNDMPHISKCLFIQCLTSECLTSECLTSECLTSECLTSECLTCPSAHSFSFSHRQVYCISKCLIIHCLMPPSVSHIQASHIIMFIIQCLTPPSAWSFVVSCLQVSRISMRISHNHVYSSGVSYLQVYHTSKCPAYPNASHIRVSHVVMPIHSVSRASKCLTYPSAYSFSCLQVSHISKCSASKCLFVQCHAPNRSHTRASHTSKWLAPKHLTCPSVDSFSVMPPKCLAHSDIPYIQVLIHSHASKCLFIHLVSCHTLGHLT